MSYTKQWLGYIRDVKETNRLLDAELTARLGLTLYGFSILFALAEEETGRLRLNVLQDKVGLRQSALSRHLMRIERDGTGSLERTSSKSDKRGIYIGITPMGLERLERAKEIADEILRPFLEK